MSEERGAYFGSEYNAVTCNEAQADLVALTFLQSTMMTLLNSMQLWMEEPPPSRDLQTFPIHLQHLHFPEMMLSNVTSTGRRRGCLVYSQKLEMVRWKTLFRCLLRQRVSCVFGVDVIWTRCQLEFHNPKSSPRAQISP